MYKVKFVFVYAKTDGNRTFPVSGHLAELASAFRKIFLNFLQVFQKRAQRRQVLMLEDS